MQIQNKFGSIFVQLQSYRMKEVLKNKVINVILKCNTTGVKTIGEFLLIFK